MPLIVFGEETLAHERYIKEVLSVAKKYDDKAFGNGWMHQEDGARPHIRHLTQ